MTSRANRNDDRMVTAAEAVRILSASAGGAAGARIALARQLRDGTLIARASRLVERTSVSAAHRERFRQDELRSIGRVLLPSLSPAETHTEGQQGVTLGAALWRDLFAEDGELRETDWTGERLVDWTRGDFTLRVCRRLPVDGWEGDRGDWTETLAIDVRFPAARLLPIGDNRLDLAAKAGRPKGAGGWAAADAALVARMHEIIADDPGMTVHRAAGLVAEQAKGNAALETRQRRLARRYRETHGG